MLDNFSCGISVILILNCGIAVFSKLAGCVFLAFWVKIRVCDIAVLDNFSFGISVILILNCGIAVFSKLAGCVF